MAAKASKIPKGLELACPFCGQGEESLTIDLRNLRWVSCGSCSEEFSVEGAHEKAVAMAAGWAGFIAWLETAPVK